MYAANITRGVWKPKSNKGIANLCIDALKRENARRKGGVHFIHVKGHSNNAGNDRADDRVQWGKMDGPYCRFRSDGTSEGDFIDKPRPTSPKRSSLCTPSPSFRIHQFNRPASKARRNLFKISTPVSPIHVCVTCSDWP